MRIWLILIFVAAAISAAAQKNQGCCTIRIDVVYANGGHAPAQLSVRLTKGVDGMMVGMANTNTLGTAEFSGLDPGNYQVVVSGEGIETASSGTIEVNDWNTFQSQLVVVRSSARTNILI